MSGVERLVPGGPAQPPRHRLRRYDGAAEEREELHRRRTSLFLAEVGAFICSLFLFLFSGVRVVRTGFGTADVHPALPALLTSVLWEIRRLRRCHGVTLRSG